MKNKSFLILLIPMVILLSGCWDLNEPERMYYAFGAGIDYQDEEYIVSIQIISFANVAKTEQVNQDVIQSQVSSASGKTIDEALFKLYHAIDERVFWGHFSFVVFSIEALQNERFNSIINAITRFSDTRYNTWVYCTDEPLEQFLTDLPILKKSITLTKIADPTNSYEQESFIAPINFRNLIIKLNEPSHEAKIPYVKLKKDWQTQNTPLSSTEISGVGIVSPNEFKGLIEGENANGLQWMSNETVRGEITTSYDKDKYLSATLQNIKVKIVPNIIGKDVKFDIHINLNASLASFDDNLTPDKVKEQVMKAVKNEIEQTYKVGLEMNVDIFRFSEILYRKDVHTWKELHKDGKIKLNENSIGNINSNFAHK
ncbi:Ger(x)C family spore germination protein [Ureibacillus massiliensis]|uniref:Ger(x)C family spore germination protein n=1 Tax=Ureibacillus massiliensis TaxID=292806 RepID=UPI00055C4CD6|nr:Ger(x)C family spore germination protein [Ureibacillus massiliensis]